ncbi:MAG: SH3 domain-containing protein [Lachnospiraceae bacterium]|nr:SH3 domain-containing protein [Lachnospiraceae bacterium]
MQRRKHFLNLISILFIMYLSVMLTGCLVKEKPEETGDPKIKEEISSGYDTEPAVTKEDKVSDADTDPVITEPADEVSLDEEIPEEKEDEKVSRSADDILDEYINTPDLSNDKMGYFMFDVNADGKEELFITQNGRIRDMYARLEKDMRLVGSFSDDVEVALYPEGMLKVSSSSNGNSTWFEYCDEFEDYFPVYEQCDGQYYTFCSYNLNDEEMEEIRTSLNSTGCYPVWLFEWSDVITKKEYESLTPKTKSVSLPAADKLTDRDSLTVRPEYIRYVNAPDGYANLRTGPGTDYDIICKMPNHDELEVYMKFAVSQNANKWLKVAYFKEDDSKDGYTWLTGWVSESQLDRLIVD